MHAGDLFYKGSSKQPREQLNVHLHDRDVLTPHTPAHAWRRMQVRSERGAQRSQAGPGVRWSRPRAGTRQRHLRGSGVRCPVLVGNAAVSSASEQAAAGCLSEKCHRCQLLQPGTGAPAGTPAVLLQLSWRMPQLMEPAPASCTQHRVTPNSPQTQIIALRVAAPAPLAHGAAHQLGPRGVPVHLMPSWQVSEKLLRCRARLY